MWLLFIAIGIFLTYSFFTWNASKRVLDECIVEILGAFFTIGIFWLIASGILYAWEAPSETEYMDLPIQSAFTDKEFSMGGQFVLGIGSVYGQTSTSYVVQGLFAPGMKMLTLPTEYYFVKETRMKSPCIENYFNRRVRLAYKSKWGFDRKQTTYEPWEETSVWMTNMVIIVPEGTVRKRFEIK
jgi:hypothetical protein